MNSGVKYYYAPDHLGSIRKMTNQAGEVVYEADYLEFGEMFGVTGTITETHGFTGKEWDADLGLYYYNARWYEPTTGRFISVDPVRQGINWYVYCRNNPLMRIDPSGRESFAYEIYEGLEEERLSLESEPGFDINDGGWGRFEYDLTRLENLIKWHEKHYNELTENKEIENSVLEKHKNILKYLKKIQIKAKMQLAQIEKMSDAQKQFIKQFIHNDDIFKVRAGLGFNFKHSRYSGKHQGLDILANYDIDSIISLAMHGDVEELKNLANDPNNTKMLYKDIRVINPFEAAIVAVGANEDWGNHMYLAEMYYDETDKSVKRTGRRVYLGHYEELTELGQKAAEREEIYFLFKGAEVFIMGADGNWVWPKGYIHTHIVLSINWVPKVSIGDDLIGWE